MGQDFIAALPLSGASQRNGEKKDTIGKGKQAQTLKPSFSCRTASGEEMTVTAVTKEFKKGRNWELFFHNEYVALARLSCKSGCPASIPKVLGFNKDRGHVLVEYFNGQDLYSSGAPKLTSMQALARAVGIWRHTALAVAFANAHEVFHCDVNPSNILVSPPSQDPEVLLLGWAIHTHTYTHTHVCSRQDQALLCSLLP